MRLCALSRLRLSARLSVHHPSLRPPVGGRYLRPGDVSLVITAGRRFYIEKTAAVIAYLVVSIMLVDVSNKYG